MTVKDIVVDSACTSTMIRFGGGIVTTDSAVSSMSPGALGRIDFEQVVGAEHFLGSLAYQKGTCQLTS